VAGPQGNPSNHRKVTSPRLDTPLREAYTLPDQGLAPITSDARLMGRVLEPQKARLVAERRAEEMLRDAEPSLSESESARPRRISTKRLGTAIASTAVAGIGLAAAAPAAEANTHVYCNAFVVVNHDCSNKGKSWHISLTNWAADPNHSGGKPCIDALQANGHYTYTHCGSFGPGNQSVYRSYRNTVSLFWPRVWPECFSGHCPHGGSTGNKSYVWAQESGI
jgi:hypothetical protein